MLDYPNRCPAPRSTYNARHMNPETLLASARRTLDIERDALAALPARLGADFGRACATVLGTHCACRLSGCRRRARELAELEERSRWKPTG